MFYSRSTGGFYSLSIHGDGIPPDAVEISLEDHSLLISANAAGKAIVANKSGYPVAIDPPKQKRTKDILLAMVAEKRWQLETSGILVSGVPIKTDRESQAQITGAYTSLKSGLIDSTPWKAADGSFSLVTIEELGPIAKAVADHVSACFAAEKAHNEAIYELHYQGALDSYDIGAGWPV